MRKAITAVLVGVTAVLVGAAPAAAHGSAEPTNYLSELVRVDGDLTGVELRVVALGERIEATRTSAAEVVVLGYDNEPYLKFDASGVWRSSTSRATYLNEDRFAQVVVPDTATATATPDWQLVSTNHTFSWHDHRAHWMGFEEPPGVQRDRDARQVVYSDAIRLRIDGRDAIVHTQVTWVPPPPTMLWLVAMVLAGGLGVIAVASRPTVAPLLGVLAALGALVTRPAGVLWFVIPVLGAICAAAGWRRNRPMLSAVGVLSALVTAGQRFDVFDHSILPGAVPEIGQRLAVAETIILAAAAASSLVVRRAAPSRPQPPVPG